MRHALRVNPVESLGHFAHLRQREHAPDDGEALLTVVLQIGVSHCRAPPTPRATARSPATPPRIGQAPASPAPAGPRQPGRHRLPGRSAPDRRAAPEDYRRSDGSRLGEEFVRTCRTTFAPYL